MSTYSDQSYGVRIEEFGREGARRVFTGRRDIPTSKVLTKSGFHVVCEHNVERDFVQVIDFDRRVIGIRAQPHRLSYVWAGTRVRYTPDFALRTDTGEIIVEVKTRAEYLAKAKVRERLLRLTQVYKSVGMPFLVAFDDVIRQEPRFSNIKELRRYRTLQVSHEDRETVLTHLNKVGHDTLSNCSAMTKHGPFVVRALAAQHDIAMDLGMPLGDDTICTTKYKLGGFANDDSI